MKEVSQYNGRRIVLVTVIINQENVLVMENNKCPYKFMEISYPFINK